jgi:hypothetical protein
LGYQLALSRGSITGLPSWATLRNRLDGLATERLDGSGFRLVVFCILLEVFVFVEDVVEGFVYHLICPAVDVLGVAIYQLGG